LDADLLSVGDHVVASLANSLGDTYRGFGWSDALDAWRQRASDLQRVFEFVLTQRLIPLDRKIVVRAENDPRRRIIILALAAQGHVIKGFLHGDPIYGVYNQPYNTRLTMSHVGNYYTFGRREAAFNNELYGAERFGRDGIMFEAADLSIPAPSQGRASKSQCSKRPTALLVGYPMNTRRYYDDSSLFFYPKLQLEIRLCRQLRKLGIRVVYRPHPDRLGYVEKIIRPEVAEVSVGPFAAAVDAVDTVIFSHPSTSTLGPVLRGNKRLVLLLAKDRNRWNQIGLELLSKRCFVIDVVRDQDGLLMVDDEQLNEAFSWTSESHDMIWNDEFASFYWN